MRVQRINGATRTLRITSYEECFMARSPSSMAGKYLKSCEERYGRILQFANENSLADARVSSTPRLETCLASRYLRHRLTLELERTEILEWISTVPYTNHHKRISDDRLEGTGEWILKKEKYRTWRASTNSILLLLRGIRKCTRSSAGAHSSDQFI